MSITIESDEVTKAMDALAAREPEHVTAPTAVDEALKASSVTWMSVYVIDYGM